MADEKSIWKKEITLRKKPKDKGVRVPPAPEQAPKPDSVAELLRPIAEQPLDPVALPPVTPPSVAKSLAPPVPERHVSETETETEAEAEPKSLRPKSQRMSKPDPAPVAVVPPPVEVTVPIAVVAPDP